MLTRQYYDFLLDLYEENHFSSILNLKNLYCGTRAYRELQSASEQQSASDHLLVVALAGVALVF